MTVDKRIANLVPAHYRELAPRFITFLEKYYEWLYRASGLSDSEIADLRSDTSWFEKDLDRYIATGQLKYLDPTASAGVLDGAIDQLDNTRNAGVVAADIESNFTMEGDFNGYTDDVTTGTPDNNDPTLELDTIENNVLDSWFDSMGFDRIKRSRLKASDNIDQVLMITLLKHIYAIKGTEASIKLFFDLFFDEDITIYYPKKDIAVIDENWILDDIQVIRDDERYQEYSYVINVANPVTDYQEIFDSVFVKLIHPAGFRVELRQI